MTFRIVLIVIFTCFCLSLTKLGLLDKSITYGLVLVLNRENGPYPCCKQFDSHMVWLSDSVVLENSNLKRLRITLRPVNLLFTCASSFLTLLLYSILASNSRINKSFMSEVLPFCEAINIAKHVELIRPAPLSRLALNSINTIYWVLSSFVILIASWS